MPHNRQSPMRWYAWLFPLLLLLLGGLLVLEPQGPRSPGGHPIAQLVLALLMYGVVVIWLWCIRWGLVREEKAREQHQAWAPQGRHQSQEPAMRTNELSDANWRPWQHNGQVPDRQRRR